MLSRSEVLGWGSVRAPPGEYEAEDQPEGTTGDEDVADQREIDAFDLV